MPALRHVALVISSLQGGGAERVAATMAGGFVERGIRVTLVTLLAPQHDLYSVPVGVERVALDLREEPRGWTGLAGAMGRNACRLTEITATLREMAPQLVVSFMDSTNVLCVLACQRLRLPLIISQRIDPSHYDDGPAWRLLRRVCYPLADHVVSISHGIDRRFDWIPSERRSVIHNPHVRRPSGSDTAPLKTEPPSDRFVIAIGRLTHQKGFDLLLRAFAEVARDSDWSLVVVGEGEDRAALEALRDTLGLQERVLFTGLLVDPFAWLRRAELFVLSSRFEGFGNVIIEAMDAGVAVIVADCPSGPAEIVEHGVDGWLVAAEDVPALARTMREAMAAPEERNRRAARASINVQRFGLERHLDRWQELFSTVLSRRH